MPVDSFRWLSWSLAAYLKQREVSREEPIPWTPVRKPVSESRFALVTTGGLYMKREQAPFDLEGERRDPYWGDPSLRIIPRQAKTEDIGVAHWHYNPEGVLRDLNVQLPLDRFRELEKNHEIGSLAPSHYSTMGYQTEGCEEWRDRTGPEIARRMREERVDNALLVPA